MILYSDFCRLYETFEEGSDFYIVTELVEGGELFDRIVSKSHYNERAARDLVKLMLETIDYVHKSGYVHRDLKPENLLLMSGKGERSGLKLTQYLMISSIFQSRIGRFKYKDC